ncbi:spike base protein, RCAP_Rcc01079 family [Neorhizobium petrolearium]|uniref:spike base protein, RCAP_Rcc01079 family n=1 Tax=Neorhizobium petrolearium TaxID=515361 RepID=UPI003F1876D4
MPSIDRQLDTAFPKRHLQITPSNTVDIAIMPMAVYCAEDGTAQVVDIDGTVLPYVMTRGQILYIRPVRINATGTTGTFYALYN